MRGRFDNLPLEPWMLFSYPVLAGPAQTAREIYVRTMLGAIEMLRSGATTVVDFVYELAGFTDESVEAIVRAYRDAGLRALVVLGMGDRAYHETVVLDRGLAAPTCSRRWTRTAAGVERVGGAHAPCRRALSPPRRGHLDRARPLGAAALHRRDARRLCRARRRARPDDPHPRARDAHAGAVRAADVRAHAPGAPGRDRLPGAARQLRARDLADCRRHRDRRRHAE